MVDVWDGREFPDYAQLDWLIPIALWIVGVMCSVVGVPAVAVFMFVIATVFMVGLKLPVYLVESASRIEDPTLVGGLTIVKWPVFYYSSVISGPYWGEELERLRMDLEPTKSRVGKIQAVLQ